MVIFFILAFPLLSMTGFAEGYDRFVTGFYSVLQKTLWYTLYFVTPLGMATSCLMKQKMGGGRWLYWGDEFEEK